jgi:hypothetical protein
MIKSTNHHGGTKRKPIGRRRNTVKGTIKSFVIDLTIPNETDWKKEKSSINRFIIEKTEGIGNKLGRLIIRQQRRVKEQFHMHRPILFKPYFH